MARGGSTVQAGGVYHVISRFVGKQWFMASMAERRMYLSLLGHAILATDWSCISYALMSSHIHLGLVAGQDALAKWLRPMHTEFANWLNLRLERIGAIFVKGPNVSAVQPEGAAHLLSYIHNNPVRAGVVAVAEDSEWTSHRAYVGDTHRPRWLDVRRGLELANFAGGASFGEWVRTKPVDREELDGFRVHPVRRRGRPSTPELDEHGGLAISSAHPWKALQSGVITIP